MKTRQITSIAFLFAAISLALCACSSDVGGGAGNTGTVTFDFYGRSAVWPPTDEMISEMGFHVELNGAAGRQNHRLEKGASLARFSLAAGRWNYNIKSFYQGELYAEGSGSVDVKAGQTTQCTVSMKQITSKPVDLPEITNNIGIQMVQIPAGTFQMGSPASEPDHESHATQHAVTLTKGFYMGKHEVTQGQWDAVMAGATPSRGVTTTFGSSTTYGVGANYPMYYVTWFDTVEFCNRLSEIEGLEPVYSLTSITRDSSTQSITAATVGVNWAKNGYRLPTEAEWEYACRAGTMTAFNWGTNQVTSDQANFDASTQLYNGSPAGIFRGTAIAVGSFAPNAWGLYDMHGNVWEWCWDWYGYEDYPGGARTDPTGAVSGADRVFRGGSWDSIGRYLRSASRAGGWGLPPGATGYEMGFRVVRP